MSIKLRLKWGVSFILFVAAILGADMLVDEHIREGNDVFIVMIGFVVANYCINRYNEDKK